MGFRFALEKRLLDGHFGMVCACLAGEFVSLIVRVVARRTLEGMVWPRAARLLRLRRLRVVSRVITMVRRLATERFASVLAGLFRRNHLAWTALMGRVLVLVRRSAVERPRRLRRLRRPSRQCWLGQFARDVFRVVARRALEGMIRLRAARLLRLRRRLRVVSRVLGLCISPAKSHK